MKKFLTVIIRVYNRENEIINCINSVLSQNLINEAQILIINDGSTDNTLNVINKIKEENPYICIDIVSHEKNMGRGKALNTAKKYIKGTYCQIIDSDDEWINNNHIVELKDKLYNTNYKLAYWYKDSFHVFNIYLSEIFKKCHINNLNFHEDHYTKEIHNIINENDKIIFGNNYYKINYNSLDKQNKNYNKYNKFFNIKLFYLYSDVFYNRECNTEESLIYRCKNFPVNELDFVLMESYEEIKKELNL